VAELIQFESNLSLESAMEGTSLIKLSRTLEKKDVIKAITYLTTRLADNFNVGKKFSVEQSAIMAMDLFEMLGHETLEDIVLMFKYARQGRIGDGKDFKLDSQTVFHKWIPEYLEMKAELREKLHHQEKVALNSNPVSTKDVMDTYKSYAAQNMHKRVERYVDEITQGISREQLEQIILAWDSDEKKKPYLDILKRKRRVIQE